MQSDVLTAVMTHPGIWTARLCRLLNGQESIIHCGYCKHYANPRKRERARIFGAMPVFKGFEAPHQLHDACENMTLYRLQYLLRSMQPDDNLDGGLVIGLPMQVIPDSRNHRGWDYATRWYPLDGDEWLEQLFKEGP